MENTLWVEKMLEKKKEIQKKIRNFEKQITKLTKDNKALENEIYKNCNHNWERDWEDRCCKYKVCTICKLANMPNVYN